jgi:Fe-S oxidoreductase
MSSLHRVDTGALPMHESYAASWYACTGCLACRESCAHGNEVAAALGAGRSEAVAQGVAPATALKVISEHGRRGEKFEAAAASLFGEARTSASSTVYFPGCSGVATGDPSALDEWKAVSALAETPPRVEVSECCGLPLLEAGDQAGFIAAAARFVERTRNAKGVVFGDAGCMHALTKIAPSLGVKAPAKSEHVTELFARHLARMAPSLNDEGGPVRYHDPCRLGRGLGIYDAPRAVLGKVLGRAPDEFHHHREQSLCSGAGGQLPRTRPESAAAIAAMTLDEHGSLGGGLVVTGCVSAKRRFERAGARTTTLASLVVRSLERLAAPTEIASPETVPSASPDGGRNW